MRFFILIVGFIILIGPLFWIKRTMQEYEIAKNGKIMNTKIIDIPTSCVGTKAKWSMKIEFRGESRAIQIPGSYCDSYRTGDMVPIKYLEGSEIIILPEAAPQREFFSIFAISSFGLFITIWYGLLKKPME